MVIGTFFLFVEDLDIGVLMDCYWIQQHATCRERQIWCDCYCWTSMVRYGTTNIGGILGRLVFYAATASANNMDSYAVNMWNHQYLLLQMNQIHLYMLIVTEHNNVPNILQRPKKNVPYVYMHIYTLIYVCIYMLCCTHNCMCV